MGDLNLSEESCGLLHVAQVIQAPYFLKLDAPAQQGLVGGAGDRGAEPVARKSACWQSLESAVRVMLCAALPVELALMAVPFAQHALHVAQRGLRSALAELSDGG